MNGNSETEQYSNKGVIIAVALVMMLGTIGIYAVGQLLYAQIDDPYSEDREYAVAGTYLGEEVTGTALCVYTFESGDYRTYQFSIVLDDAAGTRLGPIGVQFSASDDRPVGSIYESLGESVEGGIPVTLWGMYDARSGVDQTLAVSDECTIVSLALESDDMSLVCTLVLPDEASVEERTGGIQW